MLWESTGTFSNLLFAGIYYLMFITYLLMTGIPGAAIGYVLYILVLPRKSRIKTKVMWVAMATGALISMTIIFPRSFFLF